MRTKNLTVPTMFTAVDRPASGVKVSSLGDRG